VGYFRHIQNYTPISLVCILFYKEITLTEIYITYHLESAQNAIFSYAALYKIIIILTVKVNWLTVSFHTIYTVYTVKTYNKRGFLWDFTVKY